VNPTAITVVLVTRDHLAAVLSLIAALASIPLLIVTFRNNTGAIDGGSASSTYGRDRFTDIAAIVALIGVLCAIAAAALLLI
jgi:hypothetical protein